MQVRVIGSLKMLGERLKLEWKQESYVELSKKVMKGEES